MLLQKKQSDTSFAHFFWKHVLLLGREGALFQAEPTLPNPIPKVQRQEKKTSEVTASMPVELEDRKKDK